jgi:hypothetical protein
MDSSAHGSSKRAPFERRRQQRRSGYRHIAVIGAIIAAAVIAVKKKLNLNSNSY